MAENTPKAYAVLLLHEALLNQFYHLTYYTDMRGGAYQRMKRDREMDVNHCYELAPNSEGSAAVRKDTSVSFNGVFDKNTESSMELSFWY
ncbi:hypothetical protein ACE6H2_013501 [Prunus campanulata]